MTILKKNNCIHTAVYENPDYENLTCLTCGEDVDASEDDSDDDL